jgi:hypothetical protein
LKDYDRKKLKAASEVTEGLEASKTMKFSSPTKASTSSELHAPPSSGKKRAKKEVITLVDDDENDEIVLVETTTIKRPVRNYLYS